MTGEEAATKLVEIDDHLAHLRTTLQDLADAIQQTPLNSGQEDDAIIVLHTLFNQIAETITPARCSLIDWIHTMIHST